MAESDSQRILGFGAVELIDAQKLIGERGFTKVQEFFDPLGLAEQTGFA
jgi:hypothetical protein